MSPFRRLTWLVAPTVASVIPAASIYNASFDEANVGDAVICGMILAVGAIFLSYCLWLLCGSSARAGLAAVIAIAGFFSFSGYLRFGRLLLESFGTSRWVDYTLLLVGVLLIGASLYCILRLKCNEYRITQLYQFVQFSSFFCLTVILVQCARGYVRVHRFNKESDLIWANNSDSVPATWKPQSPPMPRDVYYIILDRYANADVLKQFFGYDNAEFYAELEKRGFIVDRHAATCYPMTAPSMASTLNMKYLGPIFANVANYFQPVEMNEVAKLFIAAGYKYYYFGNLYSPLRKSRLATWNMRVSLLPTEFADSLVSLTPLRPLVGSHYKRQFVLEKFHELAQLANNPDRTFAYAHFLVPHPPYAFGADGSSLSELSRTVRAEPELYVEQLIATNHLLLTAIDNILAASNTKPIIILQADEGPYLMAGDDKLPREQQIAKRVGILNAVLFPDEEVRAHLPHPLMPVNTFRFVFKEYFAAPFDLLPNHVFYWEKAEPSGAAAVGAKIVDVTNSFPAN